jgi:predicted phage terminase large subunit-like protein
VQTLFDALEQNQDRTPSETSINEPRKPEPSLRAQKKAILKEAEALAQELKLRALQRALLSSQKAFTQYFWDVLEPDVPLTWNWHLDVLCSKLEKVEQTPDAKGVINIPPGTGKSLLLVFFKGRLIAKNPALRFLSASYGAHLSVRDNVKLRILLQSEKFRSIFPHVVLKGEPKERLDTTAGGWAVATSVGGPGTGEHPDYLFIDDPITEQQSRSDAERKAANDWIDRTLSTRGVVRDVRRLLIMQRLHVDDPSGHVLAKGGWWKVVFPMRYEKCSCRGEDVCAMHKADPHWAPDPLDIREDEGKLLMPQLFTEQKVRDMELALGPYGSAGQLQQRPSPEGGGLFKREWFAVVDAVPNIRVVRRVRGWDTGGTEDGGCPTVGVLMTMVEVRKPSHDQPGEYHYYIENVVSAQTASPDKLILATAQLDGKGVEIFEEREPGSSGKVIIKSRSHLLKGYSFTETVLGSDKVTRAKPFRSQCEAGNVFIKRADWNDEYLNELSNFPVGKYMDQVDASSCAFNAIIMNKPRVTSVVIGS